ncbi:MAG: helix-turn-helix transcriptional regulator [Candidatus Woesearchaeota archaeon]
MRFYLNAVDAAKFFILLVLSAATISLIFPLVNAATIHGTIYNIMLEPSENSKIEINTNPRQFLISKNGTYEFNAPHGNYSIIAYSQEGFANETLTILQDGDYVIDIVLEPVVDYPNEFDEFELSDTNINSENNSSMMRDAFYYVFGAIIVLIASILIIYLLVRQNKGSVENKNFQNKNDEKKEYTDSKKEYTDSKKEHIDSKKILSTLDPAKPKALLIIKENERITQKELRKHFPLSEAKISLIISELEHEGKIKKIKKGRGNILIYVKE